MDNMPLDIQLKIISYLPILSKEKKILHQIINNYNYYFIKELKRLNINIDETFNLWSLKNNINEKNIYNITLIQMQHFYLYNINLYNNYKYS